LVHDRTVDPGAPMLINYGAKGNGELLLYFGFVLEDNAADVLPLTVADVTFHLYRTDREASAFEAIPPHALDAIRTAVAAAGNDGCAVEEQTFVPLAAVVYDFDTEGGGEEEDKTAVANPPNASSSTLEAYLRGHATAGPNVGHPVSTDNERLMLRALQGALSAQRCSLSAAVTRAAAGGAAATTEHVTREAMTMVGTYCSGMLEIVDHAEAAAAALSRVLENTATKKGNCV
jgi:hypothetical protein